MRTDCRYHEKMERESRYPMNPSFDEIKSIEDRYQLNTYAKLPMAVERGEGVWVYDVDGRRYLDLYGGHAVALTGHCHPRVVQAVQEQSAKLIFYSNVVYSSIRALASRALVEAAPDSMDRVFFCNSGAEANETAMKIARKFTERRTIVAMAGGFHGRTTGALSATGLGSYRAQFSPLLEGCRFIPFGDRTALEETLDNDVAGIILEPVQSMAGVEMAGDEYYRTLRRLCSERGIVLIFDEVQTGLGRTGSWFFGDPIGVAPDIITMAKGIGGGVPVGAVLIDGKISKTIGRGEHGSTFGGGPLASAAVYANIQVIREENLVENAREMGRYLQEGLQGLGPVTRVKGRGLLLGVEMEEGVTAAAVRDGLLQRGIITGTSADTRVLRILCPLILNKEHADFFVDAMKEL
jgi:acetylornithine aminotransferase/acetylornithine/N-succinyldiaminopimelate aminotransferase